jgi:hypothetical protein
LGALLLGVRTPERTRKETVMGVVWTIVVIVVVAAVMLWLLRRA